MNIPYSADTRSRLEKSINTWYSDSSVTGNKDKAIATLEYPIIFSDKTLKLSAALNKLPTEIGLLTKLTKLELNNNTLSSLPSGFAQLIHLQVLSLYGNQFTELPVEVCQLTGLTKLELGSNKLASLPAEIGQLTNLTTMSVHNNHVTFLPREIGNLIRLTDLQLFNNQLTSLPAEIEGLISLVDLDLINNPNLRELPLNLGQIPTLLSIEIGINSLGHSGDTINPLIRDAILNQCRMTRDAEAIKILPARLAKWQALATSTADLNLEPLTLEQKMTLNEWLLRLERTRDFANNQTTLATTVCGILDDLLKANEFQELFFNQAEANNACCEDRAAMSLNEIFTYWKLLFTPPRERVKMMAGVARTLRLRKQLQKLINSEERESVEIFLYYETLLRQPLQLVTAIQNMAHDAIGQRDWIDQASLVQDVKENYFEELIEMPLFEKMMETQLKELNEEFQARLGENDLDKLMEELRARKIEIAKRHFM